MHKMNKEEKKIIENEIKMIMQNAVGSEYAKYILKDREKDEEYNYIGNTFMEDIIEDVIHSSAWNDEGYYNDDDIRLAIGRVLIDRLRIDYLNGFYERY